MPFQFDIPDYEKLMKDAYAACKDTMPDVFKFREEVAKNLDTYGKYSKELCSLWRYSVGIPLSYVPYVINQIPKVKDGVPYTLRDVHDFYHTNKEWYAGYDGMNHAVKGLTCLKAAANDMMLHYVSGASLQVPPINVRGIEGDAAMLHFLCRSAITHELRGDYEELMGKEVS